jgi:hypothetical protein
MDLAPEKCIPGPPPHRAALPCRKIPFLELIEQLRLAERVLYEQGSA